MAFVSRFGKSPTFFTLWPPKPAVNPLQLAAVPNSLLFRWVLLFCFLFSFLRTLCGADCISFSEAQNHLGETRCVTGKVFGVQQGAKGVHYLDFCEDYRVCPFSVVIFASDLRQIGDIRQLRGRTIEIHGEVKGYDGRAEIILSQARQLKGDAGRIPPLPKNYDVEKRGHYSAGTLIRPKTKQQPRKPQSRPIQTEEPDSVEPQ